MARRKEDLLDRLLDNFSLRGTLFHPGTLFVLVTVLMVAGALNLWQRYQHRLIPAKDYQLTAERVHINPAPKFVNVDLKRLLLEVPAGRAPHSILDANVVSRTANTLLSVGWVEDIRHIKKSSAGLDIDVSYRLPVGAVEMNQTNIPDWEDTKTAQIMPVDRQGRVMPPHLMQHVDLPRISVFRPRNHQSLNTWITWPDSRISDAASILAMLGPQVESFGVYRVMTLRPDQTVAAYQKPYELWPWTGTQVIWGNAPGKEVAGEARAEAKIAALARFVQQHGPLNQMPKRRVDIRSGKVVITQDAHVAEKDGVFDELK